MGAGSGAVYADGHVAAAFRVVPPHVLPGSRTAHELTSRGQPPVLEAERVLALTRSMLVSQGEAPPRWRQGAAHGVPGVGR